MRLFRLNQQHASEASETRGHRSSHHRLFRTVSGGPRRFAVVQGHVSNQGQVSNLGQVSNQGQDPESLTQESRNRRVSDCNPCLLGGFITMTILALLFLAFCIAALLTFFYREDISTTEKWEFLTG